LTPLQPDVNESTLEPKQHDEGSEHSSNIKPEALFVKRKEEVYEPLHVKL
jgi:hypothetical protein